MKLLAWLLLFNFITLNLFCQGKDIGTVKDIKGTAYAINLQTGQKILLKKGDTIKLSTSLQTDANSMLLLKLKNGSLKLILEKSRVQIEDPTKIQNQLQKQIDRMVVVGGTKASDYSSNKSEWVLDDNEEFLKSLKKAFQQRNYLKVVKQAEERKLVSLENPEASYYLGVSYLKLDLPQKSLPFFQTIVKLKVFEYYDLALFGMFLSHMKLGETKRAQELYLTSQKKSLFYKEMESLLLEKS